MTNRRYRLGALLFALSSLLLAQTGGHLPVVSAQNVEDGGNSGGVNQDGDADTGDSVIGQDVSVTGGRVTINATNSSNHARGRSGDADGDNSSDSFTGQNNEDAGPSPANEQTGDNDFDLFQSADASTGDAVGGQVIGVTATGDTSITATNISERVDAVSGDSDSSNSADVLVGLVSSAPSNEQEGDNDFDLFQSADSSSGDAIAGQLVGVFAPAGGAAQIVLSNISRDIGATTGEDKEDNSKSAFVGLGVGPVEL